MQPNRNRSDYLLPQGTIKQVNVVQENNLPYTKFCKFIEIFWFIHHYITCCDLASPPLVSIYPAEWNNMIKYLLSVDLSFSLPSLWTVFSVKKCIQKGYSQDNMTESTWPQINVSEARASEKWRTKSFFLKKSVLQHVNEHYCSDKQWCASPAILKSKSSPSPHASLHQVKKLTKSS